MYSKGKTGDTLPERGKEEEEDSNSMDMASAWMNSFLLFD